MKNSDYEKIREFLWEIQKVSDNLTARYLISNHLNDLIRASKSKRIALDALMVWDTTPQGIGFWEMVYEKLYEIRLGH